MSWRLLARVVLQWSERTGSITWWWGLSLKAVVPGVPWALSPAPDILYRTLLKLI